MQFLLLLFSLLAVVPRCLAEISGVEASRLLYYYTSYDLDFDVQGRNRTIARGCKGSGTDNKCDFNEFLNYIATGEPSSSPKYYEVTSGFSFVIGDIAAIIDALKRLYPSINLIEQERIISKRKTAVGLFRDLAKLADSNFQAANAKNFPIGRNRNNMKLALGSVTYYSRASNEGTILERLRKIREVQWKIVRSNSEYASMGHDRIAWLDTVEANPDLKDRNSQLFKDVSSAIRGEKTSASSMRDLTVANRAADVFQSCFK